MLKPKTVPFQESNLAGLGSALDKAARESAASGEAAWHGAGEAPGLRVWRVEQFEIKDWPASDYGSFFSGDAYLALSTTQADGGDKLVHDVYFWLGNECSQDEAGTAAYKAVELDDLLGGRATQHREVMGCESSAFLALFRSVRILEGGVASGFNHVKPEEYEPRLLRIVQRKDPRTGKNRVFTREVPRNNAALNQGDVYLLDLGLEVLQWQGEDCGAFEKRRASEMVRALDDARGGRVHIQALQGCEDNDEFHPPAGRNQNPSTPTAPGPQVLEGYEDNDEFHARLGGGRGDVKTKEEAEAADAGELAAAGGGGADFPPSMFLLSDAAGGGVDFTHVNLRPLAMFNPGDVMVLDSGYEVWVWVGGASSKQEKVAAIPMAQQYLAQSGRPTGLPITRMAEGAETPPFRVFLEAHAK